MLHSGNDDTPPMRGRKKKVNVPAGCSVSSSDFVVDKDPVNDTNTAENVDPNDPEAETSNSSESGDSSSSDEESEPQTSDSNELDSERHEKVADRESSAVHAPLVGADLKIGDLVKVKFDYNTGSKYFIGQIIECCAEGYIGNFLRPKSRENPAVFVFPNVADKSEFPASDIITILGPPTIRRGHYTFSNMM